MDTTRHSPARIEQKASRPDGRYRITGQLGLGGMGVVLEALDTWRQRRVALKFARGPLDGQSKGLRQLTREAEAQALPNDIRVCSIYDVTTYDGLPCLVMERLVGCTIEARIAAGHIGNGELLDTALQLAEALAAVHRVGLGTRGHQACEFVRDAAGPDQVARLRTGGERWNVAKRRCSEETNRATRRPGDNQLHRAGKAFAAAGRSSQRPVLAR